VNREEAPGWNIEGVAVVPGAVENRLVPGAVGFCIDIPGDIEEKRLCGAEVGCIIDCCPIWGVPVRVLG